MQHEPIVHDRIETEEQIARLSFLQWEPLGPWALAWVLQHFTCARAFWREPRAARKALANWCYQEQVGRVRQKRIESIEARVESLDPKCWASADFTRRWLDGDRHQLLWSRCDSRYPESLRQIDKSTAAHSVETGHDAGSEDIGGYRALFVEGEPAHLQAHGLAIVGGRACSERAAQIAQGFAGVMADAGLVIVSGMAEGIDAAAHLGALQAQGSTVAVMGTGVDRCYPRRHQPLRDRIAEQGAVISALLPGQGIEKYRFLQRNQLIAALCVAVLVVQARLQSGALSTAHAAADLGKQVFAIPGSIDDPRSKGCHQLIRDGASLTERIEDIYRELPWLHNALQAKRSEPEDLPQPHKTQQQPALAALLQQLGYEAFDVHQLAQSLQISYESALHQSLRWELEGLLRRESNGRYLLRSL